MRSASLPGSLGFLAGCWMLHGLLVQLVPWGWIVPDLTLIALVVAVGYAPQHWVLLSSLAGLLTTVWTIGMGLPVLLSYVIFGGSLRVLARRWDVTDQRVQRLLASVGCVGLLIAGLGREGAWSVSLAGILGLQGLMAGLAVPLARRLHGSVFRIHDA